MAALVELSQHRIRLLPDFVPEPGEPHLCASVFEQDVVDAAGAVLPSAIFERSSSSQSANWLSSAARSMATHSSIALRSDR